METPIQGLGSRANFASIMALGACGEPAEIRIPRKSSSKRQRGSPVGALTENVPHSLASGARSMEACKALGFEADWGTSMLRVWWIWLHRG